MQYLYNGGKRMVIGKVRCRVKKGLLASTCEYKGVRNDSFSENFAYVLNE